MKKLILLVIILFCRNTKACSWYDPDLEYFNLFTQNLIPNKAYEPFLLTYSNAFYGAGNSQLLDENIQEWQTFFKNELTYDETNALVTKIDIKHLNNLKAGKLTHDLFKKLGVGFYTKNKEAIDYLIEAKYLQPYMRISYVEDADSFYPAEPTDPKNATKLNYLKTNVALKSLYNAAKIPEIKLRYAYQIVRFNHYTRHFDEAVKAFKTYVEPYKKDTPIYWYALDQKAGAERGLLLMNEANWDFFQVFIHSKNKKQSAFTSMKISNDNDFQSLLQRAETTEEKNMAYFLLAYSNYSDPVPLMGKMLDNNADSDILKILASRSINELERSYLPIRIDCDDDKCKMKDKRLPIYFETYGIGMEDKSKNFIAELSAFIKKARAKSDDAFWQMTDAYLKFLNRDYSESQEILSNIKTNDVQYLAEIKKMKMLNDIVSQPKIDATFENKMMQNYADFFNIPKMKNTETYMDEPDTESFIRDILANRYFLQGEDAKSFLMNNQLSDLQYNPNSKLVKEVEDFYKKPNKNDFEKYIAKNLDNVGNTEAFFNVIYGDFAMRQADFEKAKNYYEKSKNFSGIPRIVYDWSEDTRTEAPIKFKKDEYDGFHNISSLVFGHNVWESFGSPEKVSMKAANTKDFPFIKNKMNKLELSQIAVQLNSIANENSEKGAKANQLIGNLLYNTSVLGYYRETFTMDINNENGQKFQFWTPDNSFHFYYKNFTDSSFIEPDNFDLIINFYKKALSLNKNKEEQARILFQMASAEQGKYYQFENSNEPINYDDPEWSKKEESLQAKLNKIKNAQFRTYFATLKKDYAETKTVKDLRSSCLYFKYYMTK
ncbi:hypothetical protein [Halpernia sp.]|uniref:hypothetical protein n=1 Tax=Halpernia sp. TaxID=2782209 RepID=UPI003A8F815A